MRLKLLPIILSLSIFLSGCNVWFTNDITGQNALFIGVSDTRVDTLKDVPIFSDEPYVIINDNIPEFNNEDITTNEYEYYSLHDELGRCGYAMACVGKGTMPTEERGEIGMIKPTGWHTVKYDVVDGKYLYNRCHLIGYQLTGENANVYNLITGTRYLNMEGMLPFENLIADYVTETGNHVIYRVTPIFIGDNLLATGVQMEGYSVEDNGASICFNVFAYNAQPQVYIDYSNGNSGLTENIKSESVSSEDDNEYIINFETNKFHRIDCHYAKNMKVENKIISYKSREELQEIGYSPCKTCLD